MLYNFTATPQSLKVELSLKGSNDILSELAQSLYLKYKEQLSVLQWKNIMREVVDITSKYDNTIDIEVIRKIENNGNIFYK